MNGSRAQIAKNWHLGQSMHRKNKSLQRLVDGQRTMIDSLCNRIR